MKLLQIMLVSLVGCCTLSAANLIITVNESTGGYTAPRYIAKFDTNGNVMTKVSDVPTTHMGVDSNWYVKDLLSTPEGIKVVTGLSSHRLATYSDGTWTSQDSPEWGSYPNSTFGGIATDGTNIYTSDMGTLGSTSGVVKFQPNGLLTQLTSSVQPLDIAYNDGYIYALDGYGSPRDKIFKISTTTGDVESIPIIFEDHRAIVSNGIFIWTAALDGTIHKFSVGGELIKSLKIQTGVGIFRHHLSDMDLSPDGTQLALGTTDGTVVIADSSLNSYSTHHLPSSKATAVFVAWDNVPEPTSIALVAFGVGIALLTRKRT